MVEKQLVELRDFAQVKGKKLEWTAPVVAHLAELWQRQQNLGARYLTGLVRQHILDPLNIASSLGELTPEVARICITTAAPGTAADGSARPSGRTSRRREGDALYLELS